MYIKRNEKREFESDLHDIAFSAPRSRRVLNMQRQQKKTIDYVIGIYHVDATQKKTKSRQGTVRRPGYDLQKR